MSRLVRIIVLATLFTASARSAWPQDRSLPPNVRVLAFGGFLGQLDGFCEHPGGTYDIDWVSNEPLFQTCSNAEGREPNWRSGTDSRFPVAMGGLLGAQTWLRTQRAAAPGALVLVTGNNQVANFAFLRESVLTAHQEPASVLDRPSPATFQPLRTVDVMRQTRARLARFWQEMAALDADAIGLGPEDFVRSLRDPRSDLPGTGTADRAATLYRWINGITDGGKRLPLIGSNVVVKGRNRGLGDLDRVDDDGFAIVGADDDASIGWLAELQVSHPVGSNRKLTLREVGRVGHADDPRDLVSVSADSGTSTRIAVPGGSLLPGYRYQLRAESASETTVLTFRTHAALTPRAENPAGLTGFPVIAKDWHDGSNLLIVSLVDPAVKALLGDGAWTWTRADNCWEEECEIDFMSPVDTMRLLLRRVLESPPRRKPFVVLLSALEDAQTQEVLEAFPEIRIAVLPPETLMLGRASREMPPRNPRDDVAARLGQRTAAVKQFSGELGVAGILNPEQPAATAVLVRPEWVGETAAHVSARLEHSPESEWTIDNEAVSVRAIPGAALRWETASCDYAGRTAECATYFMEWEDTPFDYGSFESYQACRPPERGLVSDDCARFASLTNRKEFDTFAGDTFRRVTNADLAIVPQDLVDDDARLWLDRLIGSGYTGFFTRFILERAIYRSFRVVRASVSGDQLVATLDKALKTTAIVGDGGCVVGISDGGCEASIPVKRPETVKINGRFLDTRLHYSIAMPEGLATALSLPHSEGERHTDDAVSALHSRLDHRERKWYIPGEGNSLAARAMRQGNRRPQVDGIVSSFEVGYTKLQLHGNRDQLKKLDVDFRSITPARTFTGKLDVDAALIDLPWAAFRTIGRVDFSRRTETDPTPDQVKYNGNTLMYGARLDAKVTVLNREIRPYGGYFIEGEIDGPPQYLTAEISRQADNGFTMTRKAAALTVFDVEPLRYKYKAVGLDILNVKKLFTQGHVPVDVTRAGIQFAFGDLHSVPIGASIGGERQDDSLFRQKGASAVLNNYYAQHESSFDPSVSFDPVYETRDRNRFQAELDFEPRAVVGGKTWRLGTEIRFRYYTGIPDDQIDRVRLDLRTRVKLTLQIAPRLEFVPMYEYQLADIKATTDDEFSHNRFEATFKVPFVARLGWGWLFR